MTPFLSSFALTFAISGCIVAHGRAEPLYPVEGTRLTRESVAEVGGYVLQIDDQRVSEGKMYEVLPGCHVIRTPERWASKDSSAIVSARTGQRKFSIDAKPGYTYVVELDVRFIGGGSTGSSTLKVIETAADGKKTPDFRPRASPNCVQEEAL